MRLLLISSIYPLLDFGSAAAVNYKRNLACYRFLGRPRYLQKSVLTVCSIKASAGKHIGDLAKISTSLHNLASQLSDASLLKKFPWDKAKLMFEERLTALGKKAVQWSLIVLLCFSFVSDALVAVSINRELWIPLGLFMGVMFADFAKEFFKVISESSAKRQDGLHQLWGIGLLFVALRIICLSSRIPGWALLAHIGNGGLMQTLWLAKELQPANISQNKEEMDSLQPSRD